MKKYYVCERNGHRRVAELVTQTSEAVTLREGEEEKVIAPSSFKRWWHVVEQVEEAPAQEAPVAEEAPEEAPVAEEAPTEAPAQEEAPVAEEPAQVEAEPTAEAEPVAEPEAPAEKPKKAKKAKKATAPNADFSSLHDNFMKFVDKMREERGIEVWKSDKIKGFHSLKKDGKIYMAFTLSNHKGVNLWMRSKAVEGITNECYHLVHMLDARLFITTWDLETYALVAKLHDASLNFQVGRNAENEEKEKAKAEAKAKKAKKSKKTEVKAPVIEEAPALEMEPEQANEQ